MHREALAACEEEQPQQVWPQSVGESREVEQQGVDDPGPAREGVLVVGRGAHLQAGSNGTSNESIASLLQCERSKHFGKNTTTRRQPGARKACCAQSRSGG